MRFSEAEIVCFQYASNKLSISIEKFIQHFEIVDVMIALLDHSWWLIEQKLVFFNSSDDLKLIDACLKVQNPSLTFGGLFQWVVQCVSKTQGYAK